MSAASPKARRSYSRSRSPPPSREYRDPGGEENVGTVFVGNLSHDTSEKTLREFFEQYGRVLEAKVIEWFLCLFMVHYCLSWLSCLYLLLNRCVTAVKNWQGL
jgi:RNA recognition motif-containing protein